MPARKDILSLLKQQEDRASTAARQAMIIQPGAIGDCILTLPLAQYMKTTLNLGSIVLLGHLDYTSIFAGRTCVDGVKSIESVDLYRLFTSKKLFDLNEWDPLLMAFAPYSYIVTFLGEPDSDFEQNLIYTAHCTHSAEVISLNLKPPAGYKNHISRFHIEQFAAAHEPPLSIPESNSEDLLLKLTENDEAKGAEILDTFEIDAASDKIIVIAPGSGSIQKCWPIENFISVAKELLSRDCKVIFLLGPAEQEIFSAGSIEQLNQIAPCASDLSLQEAMQLMSASNGFIGNDSGISHLAGAIGLKTVAIFGPTRNETYRPLGPNVQTLQIPADEFSNAGTTRIQQILSSFLTHP